MWQRLTPSDGIKLISSIGIQKLIHLLETQQTRTKNVRECTCITTKPREEGEPEKVSEIKNETMDLSLPFVESSGTDYAGTMTQKKKSNKKKASKKKSNKKKANEKKTTKKKSNKKKANEEKPNEQKFRGGGGHGM